MTDSITATEETKLPWHAPEVIKAEINLDTACSAGSNTDGFGGSATNC